MQLPLFPLESRWTPTQPADLPNWAGAKRVGLDIETRDPTLKQLGPGVRRNGYIVGVSFALEDGPAFYLPIRHEGGDNLDPTAVLAYLRDQSRTYAGTIVGANLNYDLDYLANSNVVFPRLAWQRDVQIADPLLNELHESYNLDAIGKRWGFSGKNTELLDTALRDYGLRPGKADLWRLPARYVAEYAIEDAELPLRVLRKQERAIDSEDLWRVYDLESRVQPVLLKLTRRGVRIDTDALDRVEAWALAQEQQCLQEIHAATGYRLGIGDVNKKPPLVPILQSIGMRLGSTPTGQPQIDQKQLEDNGHPVAKLVVKARKVNKLRTTFVASVRNHMTDGRVHCVYNQLRHNREEGDVVGARYGRLSCEHPNLQQQPSRDEFAAMWRAIYVPDNPDQQWMSLDYSQQEPRLLTHFAEDLNLPGARAMAERYRQDPRTDNHAWLTRLVHPETVGCDEKSADFKAKRFVCKQTYLGLCYGMGGATLARKLGWPVVPGFDRNGKPIMMAGPETQALLDKFHSAVPYVGLLAHRMGESAREWGFILTLYGRRCRFPLKPGSDSQYDWCHKAINRLIQGSAGDQTKEAMVQVDRAGYNVQLQVHDELDGSGTAEEARAIAKIMTECVPLRVPSLVDIELGPSWGEAK